MPFTCQFTVSSLSVHCHFTSTFLPVYFLHLILYLFRPCKCPEHCCIQPDCFLTVSIISGTWHIIQHQHHIFIRISRFKISIFQKPIIQLSILWIIPQSYHGISHNFQQTEIHIIIQKFFLDSAFLCSRIEIYQSI